MGGFSASTSSMDFDKLIAKDSPICRCCLSEEGSFRDLSTEYRWISETEIYEDMLRQCFNIGLSHFSIDPVGINKLICEVCVTQLRAASNFKKRVIESERKFVLGLVRKSEEDSKIKYEVIIDEEPVLKDLNEENSEDLHLPYSDDGYDEDDQKVDTRESSAYKLEHTKTTPEATDLKDNNEAKALFKVKQSLKVKAVICDICKSIYSSKRNLREHLLIHRSKGFCCDVCAKSFYRSDCLRKHLKTHQNTCKNCQKTYDTLCSLKKHSSSCDPKKFICDICGKQYRSKKILKGHITTHRTSKPFACEACGKTFNRKYNLYLHSQVHSDNRPLACNFCNKTFTRMSILKQHLLIHSDNKHVCDVCNKSFGQKSNYQRHLLVHSSAKPFPCNICAMSFKRKHYLKLHLLVHSGNKQFACHVCSKLFTRKQNLKDHLRTFHFTCDK